MHRASSTSPEREDTDAVKQKGNSDDEDIEQRDI